MVRMNPSKYNFPKLEFQLRLLKKHFTRMASFEKRYFVVHHMTIVGTGNGDACEACYDVWQNRQASAQYSVDGPYVMQHVYDKDYAWASGSTKGNLYGIHVEHANSTAGPKWLVDELTMQTSALLIAHGHILYKFGRPVDGVTLKQHDEFFATACPGPFLGGTQWKAFVKLVQRRYDELVGVKPPAVIPPVTVKPITHIIKGGDTLWGIADKYDLTVDYLASRNNIKKPYVIQPGEILQLTGSVTPTTPAPKPPTPKPEEKVTKTRLLHWNVAGSDDTNGYAKANDYRGDEVAKHASEIGFDVFLTCEAGQTDLRAGMNKILGRLNPWASRAKAIWFRESMVKNIKSRRVYSSAGFTYLNDKKYGAAFFGEREGKLFSALEVHLDYRKPAKQAKQLQEIFKKWMKDCDKYDIPLYNRVVLGDFNWDGTSDNPFKALESWDFVEKGNTTKNTFMERKHLDGVIAHKKAKIEVAVHPRGDKNMRLSDHNPIRADLTLQ